MGVGGGGLGAMRVNFMKGEDTEETGGRVSRGAVRRWQRAEAVTVDAAALSGAGGDGRVEAARLELVGNLRVDRVVLPAAGAAVRAHRDLERRGAVRTMWMSGLCGPSPGWRQHAAGSKRA